jgi:hypothetical protein
MKFKTTEEVNAAVMAQLAAMAIIVNQNKELYSYERAMRLLEETFREKFNREEIEILKRAFLELLKMSPEEILKVVERAKD